jgi:hypothetical protein
MFLLASSLTKKTASAQKLNTEKLNYNLENKDLKVFFGAVHK